MGLPPVTVGAVHVSVSELGVAMNPGLITWPDVVCGVAVTVCEAVPTPSLVTAKTRKVCAAPLVNPVRV